MVVVVGAKGIELELQFSQGCGRYLLRQVFLSVFGGTFNLAARLRMVWPRVLKDDAQAFEFRFEKHLSLAGLAGEAAPVSVSREAGRP
jgi:hypothetical protein